MNKLARPAAGSNLVATNRFFQVCFKPEDEGANGGSEPAFDFAQPTEALSLDKGAAILGESMRNDRERTPNGQFAKKPDQGTASDDPDSKVVDLKTGKPTDQSQKQEPEKAEAEEDEDLEFEFPPEAEGKEPTRRKLSELVAGFEKAAMLEKEVETLRTQATQVPADYTQGLRETLEARGRYLRGLEYVAKMFNPQPPSIDMLNPASPKHDPDAYYAAMQQYEQTKAAVENLRKEHETASREQQEQHDAFLRAHLARERESLYRAWPEAKNPEVAKKVSETLKRDYGFSDDEIRNTTDHRMFLVIRDALEFRASKAKQAEAVKVVRQKPKLVKGAARTTTDPEAAGRSQAMQKLAQTGSIHDAAKAVKGLI